MKNLDDKQISKVKELLDQLDFDSFNQSLIKDNKIIFILDKQVYRCVMPSQKTLALAEDLENKLKVEYSQKSEYVSKSKWKKILKENQDVDIDELDKKKDELKERLHDAFLDMAIVPTSDTEGIEKARKKKSDIEQEFAQLILELTEYLKPCIEERVKKKYYEYLTYHCTEKGLEDDKWEKVWSSLEEYENDNSKLAHNAVGYLQTLLLNVRD